MMLKFGFANMGYLMLLFERTFHKDLFAIFSNKMAGDLNF